MARGDQAHGPLRTCARWQVLLSGAGRQASMIWLLALQLAVGPALKWGKTEHVFAQQNSPGAVREVNGARDEAPDRVPSLVPKAGRASFADRREVAKICLNTAITADPTSEEAQFFLGVF